MVAQEIVERPDVSPQVSGGPSLHVVASPGSLPSSPIQEAEHSMAHAALVGVLLGIPIGAVVWIGIVALSLATVGGSYDAGAWFGMAALVGAFAGSFIGGWAGVAATAGHMDEVANTRS